MFRVYLWRAAPRTNCALYSVGDNNAVVVDAIRFKDFFNIIAMLSSRGANIRVSFECVRCLFFSLILVTSVVAL